MKTSGCSVWRLTPSLYGFCYLHGFQVICNLCSMSRGWLNPPLRYDDEACRHKVLDLIGDISLLAQDGNQGLLVAHIVAYKAGHSLHTEFVRCISEVNVAFAFEELTT
ncbi:UNVERIFIED_CONTAM: putative UDP-3-O-acyl-N-acetylglucosamine deacetylase 1, mitochondrial [Sesamum angustifolium]|uniref:UDP-3-O-acyl-N-acetylglucosamine deacetylase 1, mitochondrial n=1 Tax=Sesamum angustifolium TaxID=2727405 RepID=A0AAW2M5N3_9LAMI